MSDDRAEYDAMVLKYIPPIDLKIWGERTRGWIGRLSDLHLVDVQMWVDAELQKREVAKAIVEKQALTDG